MSESSSQRSKELRFLHIMKSLPCLNAKINSWIQNYERIKHSSPLLGIGFWILELVLKTWWIMFMLLLFCLPSSILNSQPGKPHNHFHFCNENRRSDSCLFAPESWHRAPLSPSAFHLSVAKLGWYSHPKMKLCWQTTNSSIFAGKIFLL